MASDEHPHNRYDEARGRFEELDVEERASFLVEATASTLARGVEEAGQALAEGLQELARRARKPSACSQKSSGQPGAAEPETAQRQTPRHGTSDQ